MDFYTYLVSIGEQGCSKQRQDELYLDFIKLSKNNSQKAIRLKIKRFELRVPLPFFERIKKDAERLKISVQKLILKLVESIYDTRVYVFISHSLSKQIRYEINAVGTNVNQISRNINTRKHNEVYKSDIEIIKKDFLRLENYYLSYCRPIDFESVLRREHIKNPEFLNHIEIMISAIRRENLNRNNHGTY
jgi:predicted HicB family RNase H-like nuclease